MIISLCIQYVHINILYVTIEEQTAFLSRAHVNVTSARARPDRVCNAAAAAVQVREIARYTHIMLLSFYKSRAGVSRSIHGIRCGDYFSFPSVRAHKLQLFLWIEVGVRAQKKQFFLRYYTLYTILYEKRT